MPSKIICQIVKARNLPMMDRKRNTTDALVEVHWNDSTIKRTKVVKGKLIDNATIEII